MAMFLAPSVADCALASVVAATGGLNNPRPPLVGDADVWQCMNEPMGDWMEQYGLSAYAGVPTRMTPLCSSSDDQRGRGVNRWVWAMERFCSYQLRGCVRWQNQQMLTEDKYLRLYAEIDRILPSLQYCLGARDPYRMPGESGSSGGAFLTPKRRVELDRHAAVLYKWLDGPEWNCMPGQPDHAMSMVRALAEWQCSGGVSFEAVMHHRAVRSFKHHGNVMHERIRGEDVSLREFQLAVRCEHTVTASDEEEVATSDEARSVRRRT